MVDTSGSTQHLSYIGKFNRRAVNRRVTLSTPCEDSSPVGWVSAAPPDILPTVEKLVSGAGNPRVAPEVLDHRLPAVQPPNIRFTFHPRIHRFIVKFPILLI